MGKFAAVYPLPGGEQLLAMVDYGEPGKGPSIRYITDVLGVQVIATVPILTKEGERFSVPGEAVANAVNAISCLSDEEVLMVRRHMAKEIMEMAKKIDKEEAQHANGG